MSIDIEVDPPEKCSDESDRASFIEMAMTDERVRKVLASIEKPPSDFDGTNCYECDVVIPQARLKTGAFRCIDCQTKIEFNKRNHRSHYE